MPERKGRKHLYSEDSEKSFEARYGKKHGDDVWGETMGKVAREQAAHHPSGTKVEEVKGHIAFSDMGNEYHVRPHVAKIHAEPHSAGHHGGPCNTSCRRGERMHTHHRRR
ncbi:MAG: hypothetical protein ACYDFT_00275 [Thermoplasmata archaeon]